MSDKEMLQAIKQNCKTGRIVGRGSWVMDSKEVLQSKKYKYLVSIYYRYIK